MDLMIANPPRRRRSKPKARRRRTTTIARRFSAVPVFAPRGGGRRRRRRSGGGGGGLSIGGGGIVGSAKSLAIHGAAATAGFIAADQLIDRLPIEQLKVGKGRALGKLAIGIGIALLGRKFLPKFAMSAAVGAAVNGGLDLYTSMRASVTPAPAKGLGFGQPGGVEYARGLMGGRLGSAAYAGYN